MANPATPLKKSVAYEVPASAEAFRARAAALVPQLSFDEKAGLLAGRDAWHFGGLKRLGITATRVADRGHGITLVGGEGRATTRLPIGPDGASVSRPAPEPRGFFKIALAPGETRSVHFKVTPDDLAFYCKDSCTWRVEPGKYFVQVGPHCAAGLCDRFEYTATESLPRNLTAFCPAVAPCLHSNENRTAQTQDH